MLLKLETGQLFDDQGRKVTIVVINIAPRFGKTQFCVIDWMGRCIAKNPKAKFIHLSYSDELALDNSAKCRETVTSAEYQAIWPVKIKSDSDSKKKWYTTAGGGVYATAAGGAVTGFGAGSLADVADGTEEDEFEEFFAGQDGIDNDPNLFYGAIIIDDPIKVDDADNEKERTKVNNRLTGTIMSRRNSRNTPIVIIGQRLAEMDMSGFVLAGNTQEVVYHLNLPAIKDYKLVKDKRGNDVVEGESLWPAKHSMEELTKLKLSDNVTFMAQYMQDPTPEEGTFFKREWFTKGRFRMGDEPRRLVKYGAGDYAVTEDDGDWSEQAIAGFDIKDDLWFIDWWEGQVTLDKSIEQMVQMVGDHQPMLWAAEGGIIRRAAEPFILKQQRRKKTFFKLEWLTGNKSKAVNAKAFQALCSQGKVHIPYGAWGEDLIAQLLKFTGKDDARDDKVDVCGLFGRLLGQTFGPSQYHDQLNPVGSGGDYDREDDGDDGGDWRTT